MYLCQARDEVRSGVHIGCQRVVYKAVLAADGLTAIWSIHIRDSGVFGTIWNFAKRRQDGPRERVTNFGRGDIPWIDSAAHGKAITKSQALKLTGMTLGAAALDFLVEELQKGETHTVQNYQKPKKVKK